MINAQLVAQLREMTGAGIMDAKKALEESGGDLDGAVEALQKKGTAKADKKSGRDTSEGRVHAYLHSTGKLGAMVEVLCETDFVARNESFIDFCNDLAMHVSATEPLYLKREDVPLEIVEKQTSLFKEEMDGQGKPDDVLEKIIGGKMDKWFSENVLLEQPFVKDEDMTVDDFIKAKIASLGENMQIRRFARFQI